MSISKTDQSVMNRVQDLTPITIDALRTNTIRADKLFSMLRTRIAPILMTAVAVSFLATSCTPNSVSPDTTQQGNRGSPVATATMPPISSASPTPPTTYKLSKGNIIQEGASLREVIVDPSLLVGSNNEYTVTIAGNNKPRLSSDYINFLFKQNVATSYVGVIKFNDSTVEKINNGGILIIVDAMSNVTAFCIDPNRLFDLAKDTIANFNATGPKGLDSVMSSDDLALALSQAKAGGATTLLTQLQMAMKSLAKN